MIPSTAPSTAPAQLEPRIDGFRLQLLELRSWVVPALQITLLLGAGSSSLSTLLLPLLSSTSLLSTILDILVMASVIAPVVGFGGAMVVGFASRRDPFVRRLDLEVSEFSLILDGRRIGAAQIAGCELRRLEIVLSLISGDVRIPVSSLEPGQRRWLCGQLGQVSARWVRRVGGVPEELRRIRGRASAAPASAEDR